MRLHEYQAKQLLDQYGVSVPKSRLIRSPEDAIKATEVTGLPAVLKAQVHAGGRGKAGGIRVATTADEASAWASELLDSRLVTHQTGVEGLPICSLLVEEAALPEREMYFAILLDTTARVPVIIASAVGGIGIEEVAAGTPERVVKMRVDPLTGVLPYQCRNLTYRLHLPAEYARPVTAVTQGAYRLFMEKDCSLVEINPLVVTKDKRIIALDAKVTLDDNALYRHPDLVELRDISQEDPLDAKAADVGINYIRLDGTVGCLVNGAGLAMATMDLIKWAGGEPANFLDVGGGASQEQLAAALEMMLSDTKVRAAWVNIFGGILRCDVLATAIVRVLGERDLRVPFIVRMNGTNLEQGMQILKQSQLPILFEPDLIQAARKAVEAAR